jgi:Zn-dependent peptidase ImmA (M78 family)
MTSRKGLAKDALMKAARVRRGAGLRPEVPLCIYDLAASLGIEVRFLDLPSLEGMYSKTPEPVIVISSLRPPGRQAYTGGHELGHHVYGHGFRIDELFDIRPRGPLDEEEFLADCFAGFLLMPKAAVVHAFEQRGWNLQAPTPNQIFAIAGWLGVGYDTLITHLRASLGLLDERRARALRRMSPKSIKAEVLGEDLKENLVIVDGAWDERAVDLQVADVILAMPGVISESDRLEHIGDDGSRTLLRAHSPGLCRIVHPQSGWSSFVRISRRGFVGRGIFRFQEEVEDDDDAPVRE